MTAPVAASAPEKLHMHSMLALPAWQIPNARIQIASDAGALDNICFVTWGGLGDQICAEPTLRYALRKFPQRRISLASEQPSLFRHLPFADVFDLKRVQPLWNKYLAIRTIEDQTTHLSAEFFAHMLTNCVDYVSICALRSQLPVADREVKLVPTDEEVASVCDAIDLSAPLVAVHPGRHWPSKTFPKDWWDAVLARIVAQGATPVIIGADTDDNRTTVDVDTTGCIDWRNETCVMETVALLQRVPVLLTNDSSPLHMAVSGDAWVGFVATCKHPDMITHWRRGKWSWRMKDFSRDGMWNTLDVCPNKDAKAGEVTAEFVDEATLRSWLPEPHDFADWAVARTKEDT